MIQYIVLAAMTCFWFFYKERKQYPIVNVVKKSDCWTVEIERNRKGVVDREEVVDREGVVDREEVVDRKTKPIKQLIDNKEMINLPIPIVKKYLRPHHLTKKLKLSKIVETKYNGKEKICKSILDAYFRNLPLKFSSVWREDIRNPLTGRKLQLDLYADIVHKNWKGLALEYQGPTHYHYPNWTGVSKEKFLLSADRDSYKKKRCKELQICLLEIPYTVPDSKLSDYICNYLESKGYNYVQDY